MSMLADYLVGNEKKLKIKIAKTSGLRRMCGPISEKILLVDQPLLREVAARKFEKTLAAYEETLIMSAPH